MAPHLLSLSLFSLAIAGCYASHPRPRNNRYLKLPVVHATNRDVFGDVWSKRDVSTVSIANRSDVAYYAQLDIGTPPSPQFVQLDTGSFELWVNPNCSNLDAATDRRFCNAVGHYDAAASSTAVELDETQTLQYGIGSAEIQYVVDDISLSGTDVNLKGVQFGVASSTEDAFSGILGLGHGEGVTLEYRNFVDELREQGVTETRAFSLALGSKAEQEGVIVFGGVDTGKFSGALRTLPLVSPSRTPDGVPRYWVALDGVALTPPSGRTRSYDATRGLAVFVDSGSTLTLLPQDIADQIAADFGAADGVDATGMYPVDCALNDIPGTLDFAFVGITIRVPYNELIREFTTALGELCYLGIAPHEQFVLLGDTMLRSTYVVFDQTNEALHIAQYVNCGSNELEITAETDLGSVAGDCDPPDFDSPSSAAGALPTVAVTAGELAADGVDDSSSGAAAPRLPGPGDLLRVWWIASIMVTWGVLF